MKDINGRIKLVSSKREQMPGKFEAKIKVEINATIDEVWNSLINPEIIKRYMFGTTAISKWKENSSLIWKGEWNGNEYEEKGIITKFEPKKVFEYTRYNNLSGLPDIPESYNTITIELKDEGEKVTLKLTEDNNPTLKAKERSKNVWATIFQNLKEILE